VPDVGAIALCERSLPTMAGGEWDRAAALAGQASAVFRRTAMEAIPTTPCSAWCKPGWPCTGAMFRRCVSNSLALSACGRSRAMSIYRKLGASSRHQAVSRSRELGLLEG